MRQPFPTIPILERCLTLCSDRHGGRVTVPRSGTWLPNRLSQFSRAVIAIAALCVTCCIHAEVRAEHWSLRIGDLKEVTSEPVPGKVAMADRRPIEDNNTLVTMDQAIAFALENNNLLEIARHKQEQNQGEFVQARSGYLPHLSVEGNYSYAYLEDRYARADQENTDSNQVDTSANQETRGTVSRGSVKFSQLLYDFGKTTGSIDVSKANLSAAEANLRKEIKRVLFQVKKSYFEVLETSRLIEVAAESVKSFSQHLERTRKYYNAGIRTRADVINAEVELSNANKNLSRALYNLKIARTTFDQTLGISPHQGRYSLKDVDVNMDNLMESIPPVAESIDALIKQAVGQRPDVTQLTKLSEAACANVDKTKAEFLPTIKIEAKVNGYDTKLTSYEDSMEAGVTASLDLFSGLNTTGAMTSAQGRLREYKAQLEELESTIATEVTESWLRTAENRESVEITLKTLALAKENLTLAEKRYQTGAFDVLEFNEAQRNLTKARIELVVSYYGYLISLARLDYVVGR